MEANTQTTNNYIIIDHGSNQIKAGFPEDLIPFVMSSIAGMRRVTVGNKIMKPMPGMPMNNSIRPEVKTTLYGEEALSQTSILRIDTTLDDRAYIKETARGLYLENFKKLNIWDETKNSIKADNYKIVFLTSPFVNNVFIDCIAKLFSSFNFNEIILLPKPISALRGRGLNSGFIIDIGETTTDLALVKSDKIIKSQSKQILFGGKNITEFIKEHFDDNSFFKFPSVGEINKFKEEKLKISLNPEEETKNFQGEKIKLEIEDSSFEFGVELVNAGELIFKGDNNLIKVIQELYNTCKEEDKNLFENIYLIGNGSKLKNLDERLKLDLIKFIPNLVIINNEENGEFPAWQGVKKIIQNENTNNIVESFKLQIDKQLKSADCATFISNFYSE